MTKQAIEYDVMRAETITAIPSMVDIKINTFFKELEVHGVVALVNVSQIVTEQNIVITTIFYILARRYEERDIGARRIARDVS